MILGTRLYVRSLYQNAITTVNSVQPWCFCSSCLILKQDIVSASLDAPAVFSKSWAAISDFFCFSFSSQFQPYVALVPFYLPSRLFTIRCVLSYSPLPSFFYLSERRHVLAFARRGRFEIFPTSKWGSAARE